MRRLSVAAMGCMASLLIGGFSHAAENGTGFYLLGSKTTMGGFVPPPGAYFIDTNYFYSGGTDIDFELGGVGFEGGVDASAYYQMPIALWVLDEPVLGGNLGLNVIVPIGWKRWKPAASCRFRGADSRSVSNPRIPRLAIR